MTTVAGVTHFEPQRPGDTPEFNRALDALEAAGPAPECDPDAYDAMSREMAAGALAVQIRASQGLLTIRERMVLAAALLPEFDLPESP
jgi:hypothetical protein